MVAIPRSAELDDPQTFAQGDIKIPNNTDKATMNIFDATSATISTGVASEFCLLRNYFISVFVETSCQCASILPLMSWRASQFITLSPMPNTEYAGDVLRSRKDPDFHF